MRVLNLKQGFTPASLNLLFRQLLSVYFLIIPSNDE